MKQFMVSLTDEEYQALYDLNLPTVIPVGDSRQPLMHSLFLKGMVIAGGASGLDAKGRLVTEYLRSGAGLKILHQPEISDKLRAILASLKAWGDHVAEELKDWSDPIDGEEDIEASWQNEQDENDQLIAWLTELLK